MLKRRGREHDVDLMEDGGLNASNLEEFVSRGMSVGEFSSPLLKGPGEPKIQRHGNPLTTLPRPQKPRSRGARGVIHSTSTEGVNNPQLVHRLPVLQSSRDRRILCVVGFQTLHVAFYLIIRACHLTIDLASDRDRLAHKLRISRAHDRPAKPHQSADPGRSRCERQAVARAIPSRGLRSVLEMPEDMPGTAALGARPREWPEPGLPPALATVTGDRSGRQGHRNNRVPGVIRRNTTYCVRALCPTSHSSTP